MDKNEYIEALTGQIRCQKARTGVAEEIGAHIEDQARTYREFGLSEEEACQKAVEQMGDPVEAGVALDHIHRPRFEWRMFLLILFLSAWGLILLYRMRDNFASPDVFYRQCIFAGVGIILMLLVYFADYSFFGRYADYLFLLLTAGSIIGSFWATRVNGVKQVLYMPMYLYVPILAGILYRRRGEGYLGICKCIIAMVIPMMLCLFLLPSVQTACNLALIFLVMLLLAVGKGWFTVNRKRTIAVISAVTAGMPAAFLLAGYYFLFADYQKARLLAFGQPEYDYIGNIVRELMSRSNFLGGNKELMEMSIDMLTLNSEYAYTHLIINYGVLAGVVLAALLILFVIRFFHISARQKNQLGVMLGVGCGMVFLVVCVESVLMNVGLGVRMTVFLPFFSYGMMPALVYYILAGIILSVYRYQNILPASRTKVSRQAIL